MWVSALPVVWLCVFSRVTAPLQPVNKHHCSRCRFAAIPLELPVAPPLCVVELHVGGGSTLGAPPAAMTTSRCGGKPVSSRAGSSRAGGIGGSSASSLSASLLLQPVPCTISYSLSGCGSNSASSSPRAGSGRGALQQQHNAGSVLVGGSSTAGSCSARQLQRP